MNSNTQNRQFTQSTALAKTVESKTNGRRNAKANEGNCLDAPDKFQQKTEIQFIRIRCLMCGVALRLPLCCCWDRSLCFRSLGLRSHFVTIKLEIALLKTIGIEEERWRAISEK